MLTPRLATPPRLHRRHACRWSALTGYVAEMQAAWLTFATAGRRDHPDLRILFAILAGGAPLPEFFEIDDSVVTGGAEGSGADMLHFTSGGDTPGPVA